jgi:hypothetical protein
MVTATVAYGLAQLQTGGFPHLRAPQGEHRPDRGAARTADDTSQPRRATPVVTGATDHAIEGRVPGGQVC